MPSLILIKPFDINDSTIHKLLLKLTYQKQIFNEYIHIYTVNFIIIIIKAI